MPAKTGIQRARLRRAFPSGMAGFAGISLLPGLMKPRNSADIACEGSSAAELCRIACLGDYSGGGKCAHAWNCCEELSYLVRVESELDVGRESADSRTEGYYIFAGVAHL